MSTPKQRKAVTPKVIPGQVKERHEKFAGFYCHMHGNPDGVALLNETFNATEKDVSVIVSKNQKLQATVTTVKIQVASYEKEVLVMQT